MFSCNLTENVSFVKNVKKFNGSTVKRVLPTKQVRYFIIKSY